jgi:L-fucose isomerase-like protein
MVDSLQETKMYHRVETRVVDKSEFKKRMSNNMYKEAKLRRFIEHSQDRDRFKADMAKFIRDVMDSYVFNLE